MENSNIVSSCLANGLRYAIKHEPKARVSYIGIIADAGSCDDPAGREGLAHFLEHTIFKGTAKRSSWQISNRMECVGGELNAYTSREETLIYANAPAGNEARALELIADLIANSQFPEPEVEREKDVVIEEINSYLDSPYDRAYDEFDDIIYAGTPVGHNILGSRESVMSISPDDLRGFIARLYTAQNLVIYCLSPESPSKIEKLIGKYFSAIPSGEKHAPRIIDRINPPFDKNIMCTGAHQTHTIMGTRIFGRNNPKRFALMMFNSLLGGPNMSSILNQQLREKHGLVYTVDSNAALLSDTGTFTIYFGTDEKQVRKCRKMVEREIEKLASTPLSARAFDKLRTQYLGHLMMNADNRESIAMALGKSLFYYGECRDVDWTASQIREVTSADLRDMARLILDSSLSRLTLS